MHRKLTIGLLAGVALATGSLGCDEPYSCDAIAYRGGVAVTLDGASPARYRVQIDALSETVVMTCEATACTTELGGDGAVRVLGWSMPDDRRLIIEVFNPEADDGPAQLELRVARDGVDVLAVALTPTYQDAPSGGCGTGPGIRRARVTQTLP